MKEETENASPDTGAQTIPPVKSANAWKRELFEHLRERRPNALPAALPAVNAYPTDAEILLMTVMAALFDEEPDHALRFLQRFTKRFRPARVEDQMLRAIALAQQGQWTQAAHIVEQHGEQEMNGS